MKPRTAWIVYSLLRLLFFAVPFAVLYPLSLVWFGQLEQGQLYAVLLAALLSTLIATSLSVILLSKPRETASASIHDWRNRERTPDDIVEDEAVDSNDDKAE